MTAWTEDELRRVAAAVELQISSRRSNGTLRPAVTIWHAVVGGELYVRSARGPDNGWFRRALRSGVGRITSGGVAKDVTFRLADPGIRHELDAALHAKYDGYGWGPVGAITGDDVLHTTLLVMPRS